MGSQVQASFEVASWDEAAVDEHPGAGRLTRATVMKDFSGDIDGTSVVEYLMTYDENGSATFVGMERVRGTIAGRTGSLILQHVGRYEDGAATASLFVAPGSGTEDLETTSGAGNFRADPQGSVQLDLSF